MQWQFWQWPRKRFVNGEWIQDDQLFQGALRQSYAGVWEYVFPEESLPEVLKVFGIFETGSVEGELRPWLIRKAFKLEKIPKEAWEAAKLVPASLAVNGSTRGLTTCTIDGAGLYPLGILRDRKGIIDFGDKGKFDMEQL